MDRKSCEESVKEASSDFNCEKKILHAVDNSIVLPTPEKTSEPLRVKSKEKQQTQLPEKYRNFADLFRYVSCSLRLLHLRKKSPSFQNIRTQVEVIGKRKFCYAHLAQMKYILAEGINIDKVLVHDNKSLCMKPDLKITLVFEVVEEHIQESADMAIQRYFSSRLINFFNMHPEATDIPEAILPEPFSRRTCSLIFEDFPVNSSTAVSSTSNPIELLPEKFELYPSFSRCFSQKLIAEQIEEAQCSSSNKIDLSSYPSDCLDNQKTESSSQKGCAPLHDCDNNLNTESGQQKESFVTCFQPSIINTQGHMMSPPHYVGHSSSESPDIKGVSCPDSSMTKTPAQLPPTRLLPVSDVKLQNMTAQKSTSCFKPAKRVLDFSLTKGNDDLDNEVDMLESSNAPHEFDNIPKPSRGFSKDCNSFGSVAMPQEVEESLGDSFEKTNLNRAGLDAGHKNFPSLVDLVNVIDYIFHSIKRTSITKEELLQKIIMNSLDFVEIREAEEQIEILEKLVPDWICKKSVSTGDIMYCIKKVSDLDSVRSRICSSET